MELRNVKIYNFRGISELDVALDDYSLLVGPNNAGKSSVIDAIRTFYEKDGFKFKEEHDLPKGYECTDSWVELTFQLNDEEYKSLADDYKATDKRLRLRKYFLSSSTKRKAGTIYGYNIDGELSENHFYGAKNVQSGKLGDIVYIPAISRVDEHTKLSGPSALRDLLTSIMENVVKHGQAYGDFSKSVQQFSEAIHEEPTEDQRSLAGLESSLNEMLTPWNSEFRLNFRPPSAAETIKSLLDWDLIDNFHGKPQGIDYFGSGFQRHFIFSLIQLGSNYAGEKLRRPSKDFMPSFKLLLFEEPEAFLHPPQQEVLARSLMKLASSTDNWQVLCATHSSNFVSKNTANIPSIIRLRHAPCTGDIENFQVNSAHWDAIVNDNQRINEIVKKHPKEEVHPDDEQADMEAIKYFLWLNPDRSNLFFANHVLLVEGPTEVAIINRLIDDGKIASEEVGLCVVDCFGKYNVHRFMKLLTAMGISHSVIYDDDDNKTIHKDINKLITDSVDSHFTMCVRPLSGNLEKVLDLELPRQSHRKPQHALFQYESGRIAMNKIDHFCRLVESSLPKSAT